MEVLKRKRLCSGDPPYMLQQKILVNDKIVNKTDKMKMQQVHDKTLALLFSGARTLNLKSVSSVRPLHEQVLLSGNGIIQYRLPQSMLQDDKPKKAHVATCCERNSFVFGTCLHCQTSLCEYCGYSCFECCLFLCNSCVTLFGCGTVDRPLCNTCALFE